MKTSFKPFVEQLEDRLVPATLSANSPLPADSLYGPGVYKSTDSGRTWQRPTGRIGSIVVDPADPSGNTYYVGTANGGVWKTKDGGASYQPGIERAFADFADLAAVVPAAPGGNDSIWIDVDPPVMKAPDGRKFKPLFAPLIVDLDGRLNVGLSSVALEPTDGTTNTLLAGERLPSGAPARPLPVLMVIADQGF